MIQKFHNLKKEQKLFLTNTKKIDVFHSACDQETWHPIRKPMFLVLLLKLLYPPFPLYNFRELLHPVMRSCLYMDKTRDMKKIVIMGATSGIGLRVAERLAGMGWLVGAAGRNDDALAELKNRYPENVITAPYRRDEGRRSKGIAQTHRRDGGYGCLFPFSRNRI